MAALFDREYILDLTLTLAVDAISRNKTHFTTIRSKDVDTSARYLISGDPALTCEYILLLIRQADSFVYGGDTPRETNLNQMKQYVRLALLKSVLSKKVKFSKQHLIEILHALRSCRPRYDATILDWPLELFLKRIHGSFGGQAVPDDLHLALLELKKDLVRLNSILRMAQRVITALDEILAW